MYPPSLTLWNMIQILRTSLKITYKKNVNTHRLRRMNICSLKTIGLSKYYRRREGSRENCNKNN